MIIFSAARGKGYAQFLSTLDDGRIAVAALALGCIRACRDLSVAYALERQAFGGPIGRKQAVAFKIADLDVMCHAAGLLVYAAATMRDRGAPAAELKRAASVAKLYATESAVTATRIATQVFGGYGFMEEYPVARFYRDAKVLEIGEGTSEVQRVLIARALGLPVESGPIERHRRRTGSHPGSDHPRPPRSWRPPASSSSGIGSPCSSTTTRSSRTGSWPTPRPKACRRTAW